LGILGRIHAFSLFLLSLTGKSHRGVFLPFHFFQQHAKSKAITRITMGNCTSVEAVLVRHRSWRKLETETLTTSPEEDSHVGGGSSREFFKVEGWENEESGVLRYQTSTLGQAKKESLRSKKPILCCEVVVSCGTRTPMCDVFRHPLIVEAAESMFITLYVEEFSECRRGSTSVRVLNGRGQDVVKQVSGDGLSLASVTTLMIDAAESYKKPIPVYLQLLQEEACGRTRMGRVSDRVDQQAVFGMKDDTRQAEADFAGLGGVLSTRTGYLGNQQVIRVTYDSTRLCFDDLVRFALQRKFANTIFYKTADEKTGATVELEEMDDQETQLVSLDRTPIKPHLDPKHFLRTTMLRFVPLTDLQATRANRLVSRGVFNEAMQLLSPRQGMILMQSMQNASQGKGQKNEFVDVPITKAWKQLSSVS